MGTGLLGEVFPAVALTRPEPLSESLICVTRSLPLLTVYSSDAFPRLMVTVDLLLGASAMVILRSFPALPGFLAARVKIVALPNMSPTAGAAATAPALATLTA